MIAMFLVMSGMYCVNNHYSQTLSINLGLKGIWDSALNVSLSSGFKYFESGIWKDIVTDLNIAILLKYWSHLIIYMHNSDFYKNNKYVKITIFKSVIYGNHKVKVESISPINIKLHSILYRLNTSNWLHWPWKQWSKSNR